MQGTEIGKTTLNRMTEFSPPMLRFLSSYSSQEFMILQRDGCTGQGNKYRTQRVNPIQSTSVCSTDF